jgi:hypothetical protein
LVISAPDGRLIVVELEVREVGQEHREEKRKIAVGTLLEIERRPPFVQIPSQLYLL